MQGVEQTLKFARAAAAQSYHIGNFKEGLRHARRAWELKADAESAQLMAIGHVGLGQFEEALRFHGAASSISARER